MTRLTMMMFVSAMLLSIASGCTSARDKLVGAWRLEPSCSNLGPAAAIDPNAPGAALGQAMATALIAGVRLQFSEDGTYASSVGMNETTGTWTLEEETLTLLQGTEALARRVVFNEGRPVLTTQEGAVLCLRAETAPEAEAYRQAVAQAAERRRQDEAAAAGRAAAVAAMQGALSVDLQTVSFVDADYLNGRIMPELVFRTRITNRSAQPITALRGSLVYVDSFGEEAASVHIQHESPIPAGAASDIDFALQYNQFMADHAVMRRFVAGQTIVRWTPTDLVFADGTRMGQPAQ